MLKKAWMIFSKFGLLHFLKRLKFLILAKLYDYWRNVKYFFTRPSKEKIIEVLGSKMIINPNDFGIHRDLYLDKIREPLATVHIQSFLKKNDVVLEVGANIGYYALIEAQICKKVYAVEPVISNINHLKRNIKLNNYKNIDVCSLAFGSTNQVGEIQISNKANWHSFYKPTNSSSRTQKVQIKTVDSFVRGKLQPTFIKMDVEGYELEVIRGMKKTLKNVKRLFIEIHSSIMKPEETEELIKILLKNSFKPEKIIKYDRPLLGYTLPPQKQLIKILQGDQGIYEVFFVKKNK